MASCFWALQAGKKVNLSPSAQWSSQMNIEETRMILAADKHNPFNTENEVNLNSWVLNFGFKTYCLQQRELIFHSACF